MSQTPGRPCPACGTPVPAGQRFCSNCGTDLSVSGPASRYGGSSPQQMPPYGQPQQQVPPYAQAPGAFGQQPLQPYQQPQRSNPIAEALGALGLLFFLRRYRPGYRPRRQSSGCCGCLVALVILLLIFGVPAYFYYRANPNVVHQIQSQFQNSNSNTGNSVDNGNGTPSTPITRSPVNINQSVKYDGVTFTIESVQQATSFTGDNSSTDGVVRVKYKETNNSGQDVVYFANDIYRLILPDKSSVTPANSLQGGGIQNQVSRENWVDFATPISDNTDQMTLVLGASQESQISIPLTGNANLSAFQDKMVTLNKPISYNSLNYTLRSATESFSIPGKQATTGMRYIVLSFRVDNPTSNDKPFCSPQDYMRLKAGGITTSPVNYTLPCGTNANTSGATGTVSFLVPENNTAYTLIFLAAQGYSNVQVNTDFTIQ